MTEVRTWLIVPCQGARADALRRFLKSVRHERLRTIVVTTDRDPVPLDEFTHLITYLYQLPWTGHHISRWWNVGLDLVENNDPDAEVICGMSSDTLGNPLSLPTLAGGLRYHGWAMASPNWFADDTREIVGRRTVTNRTQGACWAIRGDLGLRCDEDFRWWYTEDDFEMQARQHGPVGLVGQTGLIQTEPDTTMDDTQAAHAVEDRARFVTKWGMEPW